MDIVLQRVLDLGDALTQLSSWYHAIRQIQFKEPIRNDCVCVHIVVKSGDEMMPLIRYFQSLLYVDSDSSILFHQGSSMESVNIINDQNLHQQESQTLSLTTNTHSFELNRESAHPLSEEGQCNFVPLISELDLSKTEVTGGCVSYNNLHCNVDETKNLILKDPIITHEQSNFSNTDRHQSPGSCLYDSIKSYPDAVLNMQNRDQCPICLEQLCVDGTCIATTFCEHTFHAECLRKSFDATCPVCRKPQVIYADQPSCLECSAIHVRYATY